MPIAVRCQCGNRYQVGDQLAGKSARCRCGSTITIPPQSSTAVATPPAGSIALTCAGCGRAHSAPENMAGRMARCDCGTTLQVPFPSDGLMPIQSSVGSAAGPVDPFAALPSASNSSPLDEFNSHDFEYAAAATASPPIRRHESQLLAQHAVVPARKAKKPKPSGAFAFEKRGLDVGVIGGVLMILAAGVWFVGGLAAGYIFFYPPVLVVIGIISVCRGLFGGK